MSSVSRENNFNLLRLVSAIAVVALHAVFVCYDFGETAVEKTPIYGSLAFLEKAAFFLGYLGLDVFFVISGYLITRSLLHRQDLIAYARARFFRIFPGLVFVTLLVGIVVGPVVTSLDLRTYFTSVEMWTYIVGTSLTTSHAFPLPGVFEQSTAEGQINIPLWTLKYEIVFYIATGLAFAVGVLKSKPIFAAAVVLFAIFQIAVTGMTDLRANSSLVDHLLHFGFLYACGSLMQVLKRQVDTLALIVGSVLLASALVGGQAFTEVASALAISGLAILIGSARALPYTRWFRFHDYSYGIYIFHWPVIQILHTQLELSSPLSMFLMALPPTFMLAALSWHLIEKPALGWKQNRQVDGSASLQAAE